MIKSLKKQWEEKNNKRELFVLNDELYNFLVKEGFKWKTYKEEYALYKVIGFSYDKKVECYITPEVIYIESKFSTTHKLHYYKDEGLFAEKYNSLTDYITRLKDE